MGFFSRNKKPASHTASNVSPDGATQLHLLIAEIRDGVVVLKDGSVRAVLKVDSINFDLMSEQEQNITIYAYQEFLNTLEFPIQILIRSVKLDIERYLENMDKIAHDQHDDIMKQLTYEYIDFIGQLVEMGEIMQKEFYVIVPHAPLRATKGGNPAQKFFRDLNPVDTPHAVRLRAGEFDTLRKTLNQRINNVRDSLSRCNLNAERLDTQRLIQLFYNVYNPSASMNQNISDLSSLDIPLYAARAAATPTDDTERS